MKASWMILGASVVVGIAARNFSWGSATLLCLMALDAILHENLMLHREAMAAQKP